MTPLGIDPATFRFVAQCLNNCATACPNKEEYQEYFLTLPIVLKSGSLGLLEPSGPVQACNGIALLAIFWA
jgi:hypothetical protein